MNRTIHTLTALLVLTLTLGAAALPAAASRTISGTITAAGGHSLKGTIVIACPKDDCDSKDVKGTVIETEGAKVNFTIKDLQDVEYTIYAAQDTDGNEDMNVGDWVNRDLLEEREPTLIKAGTQGVKLELVQIKKAAQEEDGTDSSSSGNS